MTALTHPLRVALLAALALLSALAFASPAAALEQRLTTTDGLFGYSVASDDDTNVAGAPERASASVFFSPLPTATPPEALPPHSGTTGASAQPPAARPVLSRLVVTARASHRRITFTLSSAARV